MNHSASPFALLASLARYRALTLQMVRRDIAGRYRGSLLGVLWSLATPLVLLGVYGFVFSVVFEVKLGLASMPAGGMWSFALALFTGLIVHALFAEVVSRSPSIILENTNLVKKVVFPLEIFSFILAGTALFHFAVSLGVLLFVYALVQGTLPLTVLYAPLLLLPFICLLVGISWILSALGVFIRDTAQVISLMLTVLMFLSPVFYSRQALPEPWASWLLLNPLTFVIEQLRGIVLAGQPLHWQGWSIYCVVSLLMMGAGYALFQKARKGFADVL